MDRFTMQFSLGYVQSAEEVAILSAQQFNHPLEDLESCATLQDVIELKRAVRGIRISDELKRYAVDLVAASRSAAGVQLGASPRASIYLNLAARAHAFLRHRGYVTPEDIKAIGIDVLRHRVILTYEAEAEEVTTEAVIRKLFERVEVP